MKNLFCLSCLALAPLSAFGADAGFKEAKAGTMSFQWKVEGKSLDVKVRAKSDGWVGIGFNASKAMKDATFIIGAEKDGKVKVENHFGTSERAHTAFKDLGCKDIITNTAAKRDGDFTEISFTMPIDANDKCVKPIAIDKDIKVLLAHGSRKVFTAGHPFVGQLLVNLSTGASKSAK